MQSIFTRSRRLALLIITVLTTGFSTHSFAATPYLGPFAFEDATSNRDDAQVYLPTDYVSTRSWPVVVALHGYMGSSTKVNAYMGLSDQVTARGFILVIPNGKVDSLGMRFWNAGAACCDFDNSRSDDVGYIENLVKQVQTQYAVDADRIFAVGHSNGGFMAHRLACESALHFKAIASFAGTAAVAPVTCTQPLTTAILQIHALNDRTIQYEGGSGYLGLDPYTGAREIANRWRIHNGCAETPVVGPRLDITQSIPGVDTSTESWTSCTSGSPVQLWTIQAYQGGGHNGHSPKLNLAYVQALMDFFLN